MLSSRSLSRHVPATINPCSSLRARMGLTFGILVLLLSMLISTIVGSTTSTRVESGIGQSLADLAFQTGNLLDRSMFERYHTIQFLATLDQIRNPGTTATAGRSLLEQLQSSYPEYTWIGMAAADGRVRFSTGGLLAGANVASAAWFQHGQHGPTVEDVPAA